MWRGGAVANSLRFGSLAITRFYDIMLLVQRPLVVFKGDKQHCMYYRQMRAFMQTHFDRFTLMMQVRGCYKLTAR